MEVKLYIPSIHIYMGHTNTSCIYSTLKYISTHASNYDAIPDVTIDQPLYWISEGVLHNSNLFHFVIRLDGFHTLSSFVGSIGAVMNGSGLQKVVRTIFAHYTVRSICLEKLLPEMAHFNISAAL